MGGHVLLFLEACIQIKILSKLRGHPFKMWAFFPNFLDISSANPTYLALTMKFRQVSFLLRWFEFWIYFFEIFVYFLIILACLLFKKILIFCVLWQIFGTQDWEMKTCMKNLKSLKIRCILISKENRKNWIHPKTVNWQALYHELMIHHGIDSKSYDCI